MIPRSDRWRTVRFERLVLCVVRTTTALTRILDVLELIEADTRIQIAFTHCTEYPGILSADLNDALAALHALVIPWEQAAEQRFDLILAASENDPLMALNGPIILMPHGIGFQKYYPETRVIAGLNPDRILRGGTPLPHAVVLSHESQSRLVAKMCPELEPRAVVAGDPCLDRILLSRGQVVAYRAAFNAQDRALVVLISTWGPYSLFGSWPTLPQELVAELPNRNYAVALALHPGVWAAHSQRQIYGWLRPATDSGLMVLPWYEGWRAALIAADVVVSDEGSASLYAAALGTPLILAARDTQTTVPGSPLALLCASTPRLNRKRSLLAQVEEVRYSSNSDAVSFVNEAAVSGVSAEEYGKLCYRLMELPAPKTLPRYSLLPVPDAYLKLKSSAER